MGRELITLQVGQAGNAIGSEFWEKILAEHGLNQDGHVGGGVTQEQTAGLNVFFSKAENQKYVPRCLTVDLEPSTMDAFKGGKLGHLFKPLNFIFGQSGAGNNFAKGFYTEGAELVDSILDALRHETEYPDRMMATYSILPSPKVSETVVEPYDACLSFHQLVETADMSFCLDNEALYDNMRTSLRKFSPTYADLNALISNVMSGTTTTLRFPGQLNSDLRKMGTNMVPFPRLHFFTCGFAPLVAPGPTTCQNISIPELTQQGRDLSLSFPTDPRLGKYLTVASSFRGRDISSREVEEAMLGVQTSNQAYFVEWIPNAVQTSICSVPPAGMSMAGTLDSTSSPTGLADDGGGRAVQANARAILKHVQGKAFLHWYTGEGMDEMEFTEAKSNLQDLVAEYQQYEQAGAGDEDFEYEQEGAEEEEGRGLVVRLMD